MAFSRRFEYRILHYALSKLELANKNILIISNEPWGDVWFSKQNYAYELSKKNRVFFVDPTSRWKLTNLFNSGVSIKKVSETLYVLSYRNFLPAINLPVFRFNNFIVSRRIKERLRREKATSSILWTFDPMRLYDPAALGASYSIFHCVDKYFQGHMGERLLYSRINTVLCVSRSFLDDYRSFTDSVHYIPHGISSEDFNYGDRPADLPPGDYGLYVGTIDHRLDFDLIEKMVLRFSEMPFVFVGRNNIPAGNAAARLFRDNAYGNVYAIGTRHFKQLKHYIAHAAFCIAPMNRTVEGNDISHHKIFQYMALGKPVFSGIFSEYTSFSDLLYMDNDQENLIDRMEAFLKHGEDDSLPSKRSAYVRQFTFEELLKKIEQAIAITQ